MPFTDQQAKRVVRVLSRISDILEGQSLGVAPAVVKQARDEDKTISEVVKERNAALES